MNRTRYIPFERNRYFYGKLLTVRDFMSEQTYMTDKRRLANRLLFGSGVVAGLQVIAVDDKSISVETGLAFDQLGREIVVPSPVTLKLSNIEGFSHNDYAKNVYLCIAYDEKGKEPVHTAAGVTGRDEEITEYNRILESYRLFIREQPPSPKWQEYDDLIEDTSVWYDDGQVRILQSVPRFIEAGQTFELRLTVEKTLQTPHVEFEYEPEWTGVEAAEDLPDGKIRFSEPTDMGQTVYTRIFRLQARPLPDGETRVVGSLAAKAGTARLVIGDRVIHDISHLEQTVEISEDPAEDRILNAYYSRTLDKAMESPPEPCIYLAKINLLQMGATYVIDSVEPLPFQDYVMNPTLLYKLYSARLRKPAVPVSGTSAAAEQAPAAPAQEAFPDIKEEFAALGLDEEEAPPQEKVCTGVCEISIVPEKKKKWYHRRQRDFFSEEIEHGLGPGAVFIQAGLSDEPENSEVVMPEMWNRSNSVYYGLPSIFAKSEYAANYPPISLGFIQYPKKGTFRIGVRVHKKTERTKLRIRWWAIKADADRSVSEISTLEDLERSLQEAAPAKG